MLGILKKISNGLGRHDLPPLSSSIVDDMIAVGNTVAKLLLFVIDKDSSAALKVGIAAIDLLNSFVAQNHGLLTTHYIDRNCNDRKEWRAENLIAFFGSRILECVHRSLQQSSELSRIRPLGLDFFLRCSVCTESTYYSVRCLSELLKASPLYSTMCDWDYRYYETEQQDSSSSGGGDGRGIGGQPNLVPDGESGGGGGNRDGNAEEGAKVGDGDCSDANVMDIDELMGRDSPFLLPPKGPRIGPRSESGPGLSSGIAGARKDKNIAIGRGRDAVSSSGDRGSSSSSSSSIRGRGSGRGSDGISFAIKPQRTDSTYSSLISGAMDPGSGSGSGSGIGPGPTGQFIDHEGASHPAGDRGLSKNQNSRFQCDPLGLQVPRSKFVHFFTDLRDAYLNLGESAVYMEMRILHLISVIA